MSTRGSLEGSLEGSLNTKLQGFNKKDKACVGIGKASQSDRRNEWVKGKQGTSHEKEEQTFVIFKQQGLHDVKDKGDKGPRPAGVAEGRAVPQAVTSKGHPRRCRRRWRKRDFATRIVPFSRYQLTKATQPRTTWESLPKFSEQLHQRQPQQNKVVCGGIHEAAAVLQVKKQVSSLVLREQQLADVALEGYNTFLAHLTTKGSLFSHQFENEFGQHVLKLEDVEACSVQHSPLVCRQEDRSYQLPLTVRASYTFVDTSGCQARSFSHRMYLGEIPLMVGSRLCPTTAFTTQEAVAAGHQPCEPGGYFIVDGIEKYIPFRNLHKKNNLMVFKCSGSKCEQFSFKCSVMSSGSGTESYKTVVFVSTKQSLVVKMSLGRGVGVLIPLSKVLAASGVHCQPQHQQEAESLVYLRRTLSAMLSLQEEQNTPAHTTKASLTLSRAAFKGEDGGKSRVSDVILDYLVAGGGVAGVTERDLHRVHAKCERSDAHHSALLNIAAKFAAMRQGTQHHLEYKDQVTVLRDVMLQGCEDVPAAVAMVTAALTLPSEEDALKSIQHAAKGACQAASIREVLERVLVPHAAKELPRRAFYLAFMTNQLLLVQCGRREPDDPLHLGNRMLLTPGTLTRNLFDSVMKDVLHKARDTIEQCYRKPRLVWPEEYDYVDHYEDDQHTLGDHARRLREQEHMLSEKFDIFNIFQFHNNVLSEKMCNVFRTGSWGQAPSVMSGVTQNLRRFNYLQYLSQVRTVNGEDKVTDGQGCTPHQLHTSIVGFLCLMETPENENVGLTEHFTVGASMCRPVQATHVHQALHALPVKVFAADECPAADQLGKVFVDGRWVGNAEAPLHQVKDGLLEYRRSHALHLGVHLRNHDLHIDTWGGRPVRPLLVVQDSALTLTTDDRMSLMESRVLLDDLWRKGVVDFVDPLENSEAFIAETPADLCKEGVQYCEVAAVLSHGIVSAAVPMASTNPGVRRLGSCKMQKQAMGQAVASELLTHRGTYSVLKNPEMPLAMPKFILNLPNSRLMYSGQSALTAVMAVRGLNQEDGLVFSQGALDRGLFTSLHFHSYRKYEPCLGAEVTACVEVGQRLEVGDVVITCRDERYQVRVEEVDGPSAVTRRCVRFMPDGRVLYEVETVQERRPEVGDKFATLNGQKGVICGVLADHKLPKLEDGRTPDIFISPHSFLDRQTVGFFLEGILNTLAVHTGFLVDATSIDSGWDLARAQEALRAHGLSSSVKVLSPSGREMGPIFCCPIFYMRLKHLAVLKCHARHEGPVDPLFRQPTEGLAQGGGLRLGEMEVAALVSHGAAELVQELMHDQSDGLQLPYCNTCLRWADLVGEYVSCRQCRRIDNLVLRRTTYAFKYFEECLAMTNLKVVQYGQGHQYTESDMEYEDSELSSPSCDEECDDVPEAPRHHGMETIIKRCMMDELLGRGAPPTEGKEGRDASSTSHTK